MIKQLRSQKADMAVIDMSITSIRQTAVDFTMPYMNTGKQQLKEILIFRMHSCKINFDQMSCRNLQRYFGNSGSTSMQNFTFPLSFYSKKQLIRFRNSLIFQAVLVQSYLFQFASHRCGNTFQKESATSTEPILFSDASVFGCLDLHDHGLPRRVHYYVPVSTVIT